MNQKIYTILLIVLSIITVILLIRSLNLGYKVQGEYYIYVDGDPNKYVDEIACKNYNFC